MGLYIFFLCSEFLCSFLLLLISGRRSAAFHLDQLPPLKGGDLPPFVGRSAAFHFRLKGGDLPPFPHPSPKPYIGICDLAHILI